MCPWGRGHGFGMMGHGMGMHGFGFFGLMILICLVAALVCFFKGRNK